MNHANFGYLAIGIATSVLLIMVMIGGFAMGQDSALNDCKTLGKSHISHSVLTCSVQPDGDKP